MHEKYYTDLLEEANDMITKLSGELKLDSEVMTEATRTMNYLAEREKTLWKENSILRQRLAYSRNRVRGLRKAAKGLQRHVEKTHELLKLLKIDGISIKIS